MPRRLKDFHSGERAQFLKLFLYLVFSGGFLLVLGEALAYGKGWIGGWTLMVLILFDIPAMYLLARGLLVLMEGSARGFTTMVLAGGGLSPEPAHSAFESLVARGFYPEAAQAYRAHLLERPEDHLARVKLAELYLNHLDNPDGAEQLYLEIRKGQPAPREERLASNLLIELYRKTGRKDRLMVELARFAERYRGSRAAGDAARTLAEMKQELRQG